MTCFSPLQGFVGKAVSKKGKRPLVFSRDLALADGLFKQTIPCGQCIGCRLEYSRQWAVRCMHEAAMHQDNCFITLTYDPAHLPHDHSLHKDHFQKFMKRFRKKCGNGIRYFYCGEYGDLSGRPHFHAIVFGYDFSDKELLMKSPFGSDLYTSKILQSLWKYGYSSVGAVTFQSAAYVARYVTKKYTGPGSDSHYVFNIPGTYNCVLRSKEYANMSRRPGIARDWYDRFKNDVYNRDFVVMNGKEIRPPKYYDSLYESEFPDLMASLKLKRKASADEHSDNCTYERLIVRERCKMLQFEKLIRSLEK